VQTFLPYPSFQKSARVLDTKRLGKQRIEAMQILKILRGEATGTGWKNHPAVRMWRGYERALAIYYNAMLQEWERRGYANVVLQPVRLRGRVNYPPWLGSRRLHASHRANLLRKNAAFSAQYGWKEDPVTPYFWPANSSNKSVSQQQRSK
jgi:hypothetical protein